jgi:Flp pilus assembly protein TadB
VKLFEHALSVMNRALSSGANPDRVAKLVAPQRDAE